MKLFVAVTEMSVMVERGLGHIRAIAESQAGEGSRSGSS
jgi:hypothetical protein